MSQAASSVDFIFMDLFVCVRCLCNMRAMFQKRMRVGDIRRNREVQPMATHGRHISSGAARTEPRNAPVLSAFSAKHPLISKRVFVAWSCACG
jgi:hypothetical protein